MLNGKLPLPVLLVSIRKSVTFRFVFLKKDAVNIFLRMQFFKWLHVEDYGNTNSESSREQL